MPAPSPRPGCSEDSACSCRSRRRRRSALLVLGDWPAWSWGHRARRGADPRARRHTDRLPTRTSRVLPGGFDVVFDGIGKTLWPRSRHKRGGLLCIYGYTAGVQPRRPLTILIWLARQYLGIYGSGGLAAARAHLFDQRDAGATLHSTWFGGWGSSSAWGNAPSGRASPSGSFDEVAEAHRRLEAGGLQASSSCALVTVATRPGDRLSGEPTLSPRPRDEQR